MAKRVRRASVTEAARNFADIVNRAFYRHETTVLMKNGVAVAHIAPAEPAGVSAREVLSRWRLMPHLSPGEAEEMRGDLAEARRKTGAIRSPWD
jgi:hypothetical protein